MNYSEALLANFYKVINRVLIVIGLIVVGAQIIFGVFKWNSGKDLAEMKKIILDSNPKKK